MSNVTIVVDTDTARVLLWALDHRMRVIGRGVDQYRKIEKLVESIRVAIQEAGKENQWEGTPKKEAGEYEPGSGV